MGSRDAASESKGFARLPRQPVSKRRHHLMGRLSALYPNRIGKIASRSKARTKSPPATRANEKTGATYHSGQ